MKKLIVAAAVATVAIFAQASSFCWRIASSESMANPGGASYYTGTGYLFDSAAVSQASVLASVVGGAELSSLSYLQTNDIDAGDAGKSSSFSWGSTGDTLSAFYAAVLTDGDNKYLYISDVASKNGTQSTTQTIQFTPEDSSSAAAAAYGAAFAGSGWYQTTPGSSVPEPTSGLLLLLGVAGLALKRKKA